MFRPDYESARQHYASMLADAEHARLVRRARKARKARKHDGRSEYAEAGDRRPPAVDF